MIDVVRLLNSIGKKIFINYYKDFKNVSDKKALAIKLLRENPNASTLTGQITRISCAVRIFDNQLQIEALNIIINARLDDATITKAKKLKALEI